jgi:hypothetical protein
MPGANALYLPDPHSRLLCDGGKRAILKARRFRLEGRNWRFFDRFHERGVVRVGTPKRISLATARRTRWLHGVSDNEIKRWWPNATEFWFYPVKRVECYTKPRRVKYKRGWQTFAKLP